MNPLLFLKVLLVNIQENRLFHETVSGHHFCTFLATYSLAIQTNHFAFLIFKKYSQAQRSRKSNKQLKTKSQRSLFTRSIKKRCFILFKSLIYIFIFSSSFNSIDTNNLQVYGGFYNTAAIPCSSVSLIITLIAFSVNFFG